MNLNHSEIQCTAISSINSATPFINSTTSPINPAASPICAVPASNNLGAGFITLAGIGLSNLEAYFTTGFSCDQKMLHLYSTQLGSNIIDSAESELVGDFILNPSAHVGCCYYSLEEVEEGSGEMALTIMAQKNGTPIGFFTASAEGFHEAMVSNKKGHLHITPSEHSNKLNLFGDSSIYSLDFELDKHCITRGQPFDGIHWNLQDNRINKLFIDVKAGRKNSQQCADFYQKKVNNKPEHMMCTCGGSHQPSQLNFAFTGTLIINGERLKVCIGQGHSDDCNNWHIASYDLQSSNNGKSGELGPFLLQQSGDNELQLKVK